MNEPRNRRSASLSIRRLGGRRSGRRSCRRRCYCRRFIRPARSGFCWSAWSTTCCSSRTPLPVADILLKWTTGAATDLRTRRDYSTWLVNAERASTALFEAAVLPLKKMWTRVLPRIVVLVVKFGLLAALSKFACDRNRRTQFSTGLRLSLEYPGSLSF